MGEPKSVIELARWRIDAPRASLTPAQEIAICKALLAYHEAAGPLAASTRDEAIAAWNRRTPPQPSEAWNEATLHQFKLWFFRDLTDDQRIALFRLVMPVIPGRELETHAAQLSGLEFFFRALKRPSPAPEPAPAPQDRVGDERLSYWIEHDDDVAQVFIPSERDELLSMLRELRARRAADKGEPVAWQWSDFSGQWYTVDTDTQDRVEDERRQCAQNGPCSDNGDGCTCSEDELRARRAADKGEPVAADADVLDRLSKVRNLLAQAGLLLNDLNVIEATTAAPPAPVVTETMVDAALDAVDYIPNADSQWMHDALTAALKAGR